MNSESIINELADVFLMANEGFSSFNREAGGAASSGDYSTAASSGYNSKAASSGYNSKAASSGDYSTAASSGNYSTAASSGNYSTAASSGYNSKAASSGYNSKAASSGNCSTAASSGDCSKAESYGEHSGCTAIGYRAAVKGEMGNLLMASEYKQVDGRYVPVGGLVGIVDGNTLKPDCWYIVEDGKWVEVDFSDGVFSYVVSTKGGIKKIRTEDNKILYVVTDGNGNYAHGETIEEARNDLVFKVVAKFDGKLPDEAIGTEWIGLYRAITGACSAGVRNFVQSRKLDLRKTYTKQDIANLVKGSYGESKFLEVLKR